MTERTQTPQLKDNRLMLKQAIPNVLGRGRRGGPAARGGDRVTYVHTKDIRPAVRAQSAAEDWSFLKSVLNGVYTVPGDGTIDFVSIFRNLPGYSGWVVLEAEQEPAKANPFTYASRGYAHLTTYLQQAGSK
jgi:inosose dehydratase